MTINEPHSLSIGTPKVKVGQKLYRNILKRKCLMQQYKSDCCIASIVLSVAYDLLYLIINQKKKDKITSNNQFKDCAHVCQLYAEH